MQSGSFVKDEFKAEKVNFKLIGRLFRYLLAYQSAVVTIILLGTVGMVIELVVPYVMKIVIDNDIINHDVDGLIKVGIFLILINLISYFCMQLRKRMTIPLAGKAMINIRNELYTHLSTLSFEFYDKRSVGKILSRLMGDINKTRKLFSESMSSVIPNLIKMIGVAVMMVVINYKLALSAMIMLPALIAVIAFIQIASHRRWQINRIKSANLNAFIFENFAGIRVVKNYNAENKTEKIFHSLGEEYENSYVNAVKIDDFFWPVVEMSWGIGVVVVFLVGLNLLKTNEITIGALVAFTSYIGMFWQPVMQISNFYNILITNLSNAERIFELMDVDSSIQDNVNAMEYNDIKGRVSFQGVTFGYTNDKEVLKDIHFDIDPGMTVALVGPTGSGKTTITALIDRHYDVSAGSVKIDGIDVRNIKLESLRKQIGVMTQDVFLFSATIRENIRYGRLDATDQEIEEVAKAVCAHDFIMRQEKGYDTELIEGGNNLSMGQRQLIAFARTLIANPKILILDEATASIDTYTEKLIQQGIEKLIYGRTSFIVAHRLSTIKNADLIIVVDNGKISETGKHDELMKLRGKYYNMISKREN